VLVKGNGRVVLGIDHKGIRGHLGSPYAQKRIGQQSSAKPASCAPNVNREVDARIALERSFGGHPPVWGIPVSKSGAGRNVLAKGISPRGRNRYVAAHPGRSCAPLGRSGGCDMWV